MKKKRWARAAQAGKHLGSCPILHMNGFAINRVTLKRRQGAIMTRAIRVNTGNSWAILRDIILRNTASRSESYITPIKGFEFHRQVSNADPKPHFYEPVIIVVVQGKKLVKIGAEEHHYGENICFVCGVDMPVSSCVMEASKETPYLSMSLKLDTGLIASLASQIPSPSDSTVYRGAGTQEVDPDLLDAFVRLAELTEKPEQILVMRDMLMREIHYRLLIGPQGSFLRTVNTFGTQGNQVAQAISWLRNNYKEPVQVDELAKKVNMATSTFHRHFKQLTSLSPLQFQKRLRLYEAQRLMLVENEYAANACMAVGYESPTQFNREYKRLFGEPPSRNINKVRELRM